MNDFDTRRVLRNRPAPAQPRMRLLPLLIAAAFGAGAAGVRAQSANANSGASDPAASPKTATLDTVTVTVTRRREPVREVPVQVNTISAEKLENAGATSLPDYLADQAGVNVNSGLLVGNTTVTIRGVSTGPETAPTVGTYIDDVSFGSNSAYGFGGVMRLQPEQRSAATGQVGRGREMQRQPRAAGADDVVERTRQLGAIGDSALRRELDPSRAAARAQPGDRRARQSSPLPASRRPCIEPAPIRRHAARRDTRSPTTRRTARGRARARRRAPGRTAPPGTTPARRRRGRCGGAGRGRPRVHARRRTSRSPGRAPGRPGRGRRRREVARRHRQATAVTAPAPASAQR